MKPWPLQSEYELFLLNLVVSEVLPGRQGAQTQSSVAVAPLTHMPALLYLVLGRHRTQPSVPVRQLQVSLRVIQHRQWRVVLHIRSKKLVQVGL